MFPDARLDNDALRKQYSDATRSKALYHSYSGRPPDDLLSQFLTGSLLGDGSLLRTGTTNAECPSAMARYSDAQKNTPYAHWKSAFLAQYFPVSLKERRAKPDARTAKVYTATYIRTGVHPLLTEWHALWYRPDKRVPVDLVARHLTPFAFAIWLCDDGHNGRTGYMLYPMAFTQDEGLSLLSLLHSNLGLIGKLRVVKSGRPHIFFPFSSSAQIRAILDEAGLPGMAYKSLAREERTPTYHEYTLVVLGSGYARTF